MDRELVEAAEHLLAQCRRQGLTLATAESCTGGLLAACLTEVPGASDVFERGFITYSNEAKMNQLGIPQPLLARCGAVSEEVARAMADGALRYSRADLTVAVTGVAGPGGGTEEKPVGLVHLAAARRGGALTHARLEFGDVGRGEVRRRSVAHALDLAALLV